MGQQLSPLEHVAQWQTLTYFNGTVLHPLSYSLRTINVQTGAIGDVMTVDNESNTTSANACGCVLLVDENILDNGAWIDSTARFIAAANGGLVNPYPFNIQGITVGPGAVACSESGEAYYPALGSAALHHFDAQAGHREIRRSGEAVMACPNDDNVGLVHASFSFKKV